MLIVQKIEIIKKISWFFLKLSAVSDQIEWPCSICQAIINAVINVLISQEFGKIIKKKKILDFFWQFIVVPYQWSPYQAMNAVINELTSQKCEKPEKNFMNFF